MATWKELISFEMEAYHEQWSDVEAITLTDEEAAEEFDDSFKPRVQGKPFTAWTKNRVYFPICHDGAESCGSAPRNPNGEACAHQGG